jgi:adenylate cyclase, class 2
MHKTTQELEVSILDVNKEQLVAQLLTLGAVQLQKVRLRVDWFQPNDTAEGEEPWYLRIRSYDNAQHEVTWKAHSVAAGVGRAHREINFHTDEPHKLAELFEAVGFGCYAHQEKDRESYTLDDLRFDFDTYPGMPTLMEIEGPTETALATAIETLGLTHHKTWNQGERKLVQQAYNLDWYHMRFAESS